MKKYVAAGWTYQYEEEREEEKDEEEEEIREGE